MKIWKLGIIAICLIFLACKNGGLDSNHKKNNETPKMSFGTSVHNIFKNNGKYYIAKCYSCFNWDYYNNDESSIVEITLNKVIRSCQDEHGRVSYKIDSLGDKAIGVQYESNFSIMGKTSIEKGRFVCEVSNRIDTIALLVDGLPINEESAKKHIRKNKFYILCKAPSNGLIQTGIEKETKCLNKIYKKYGYKPYLIGQCIPSNYYEKQIKAYNKIVFNYLKKKKNFSFENYEMIEHQYDNDLYKCGISEWMNENDIGNGKTQKEIWKAVVIKYKNLPDSTKIANSSQFWYNYIVAINTVFDTIDIESPLKMAENENNYLTKHGLIWSCFLMINWKNMNNLDERVINRIDDVAKDVQSKYPDKNEIPNAPSWNSQYEAFKQKFRK